MLRFSFSSILKILKLSATLLSVFALQAYAASINSSGIPPKTAELGQTLTIDLSHYFDLIDPASDEFISFSTTSPIPASISTGDLLITPSISTSVGVYIFQVTASTNKPSTIPSTMSFQVAVPTAQRSEIEFPLVSEIFRDISGIAAVDDTNQLGYIVRDRMPLRLVSFPSVTPFSLSTNKISNGQDTKGKHTRIIQKTKLCKF